MNLVSRIFKEIKELIDDFPFEIADLDPFRDEFRADRERDAQWDAQYHLSQINRYLSLITTYPLGDLPSEFKDCFERNIRHYSERPFHLTCPSAKYLDPSTVGLVEQQRQRLQDYVDLYFD